MTVLSVSPLDAGPQMSRSTRIALYAIVGVMLIAVTEQFATPATDELSSSGTWAIALGWSVPIMAAGLGGIFSERAGVVNIGLEGMMILGTWFGAWGALEFNPWWGIVIGAAGGAAGGLLHAVATVTFGVDHIISGVAINIMAPGITRYLSDQMPREEGWGITQSPITGNVGKFTMPVFAGGPLYPGGSNSPDVLGRIESWDWFFVSNVAGILRGLMSGVSWITLIAYAMIPIAVWLLWRTAFGLRLRSCGEHPVAADSLGVNVYRYKYYAVIISGALAGFGGAFLAVELTGIYRENQTNGRGFIGLATVIFGNWKPVGMAIGSFLFGIADTLQLRERSAMHAVLLLIAMVLLILALRAILNDPVARYWRAYHEVPIGITGVDVRIKRKWADRLAEFHVSQVYLALAVVTFIWYISTDNVPVQLPKVVPHFTVLLVLVIFAARLRMPAADGMRYRRGQQ